MNHTTNTWVLIIKVFSWIYSWTWLWKFEWSIDLSCWDYYPHPVCEHHNPSR